MEIVKRLSRDAYPSGRVVHWLGSTIGLWSEIAVDSAFKQARAVQTAGKGLESPLSVSSNIGWYCGTKRC